ncbi:MAG TPA: HEPN domain-containing protein [Bryobacteraceae bacterium]|nr:HEPN domain-containing protein [Bryobacteraceae bacterium]
MTPEAERYLDKARRSLAHARAILAIELGEDAGRAAYLGAFHAAQAFIFERTDRVAKTHRGVHGQFLKLVTNEPRIDLELRRFLSEGYKLKAIADYETGPDATVPLEQAATAIETASRFIGTVAELLAA